MRSAFPVVLSAAKDLGPAPQDSRRNAGSFWAIRVLALECAYALGMTLSAACPVELTA